MENLNARSDSLQFLVDISRRGQHVALVSTCDADLVELLNRTLPSAGYTMHTDTTPSPIGRKR